MPKKCSFRAKLKKLLTRPPTQVLLERLLKTRSLSDASAQRNNNKISLFMVMNTQSLVFNVTPPVSSKVSWVEQRKLYQHATKRPPPLSKFYIIPISIDAQVELMKPLLVESSLPLLACMPLSSCNAQTHRQQVCLWMHTWGRLMINTHLLQSRADPPHDQAWLKMRQLGIVLLVLSSAAVCYGQSKEKSIIEYLGTVYIMPDGCPMPTCDPDDADCVQSRRSDPIKII